MLAGDAAPRRAPPGVADARSCRRPGRREILYKAKIPSRPTRLGKEEGTLEEAATRTLRLETDLVLTVPEGARWIAVIVRGERTLDDALPFMPIQPLAFTNPIWLTR